MCRCFACFTDSTLVEMAGVEPAATWLRTKSVGRYSTSRCGSANTRRVHSPLPVRPSFVATPLGQLYATSNQPILVWCPNGGSNPALLAENQVS